MSTRRRVTLRVASPCPVDWSSMEGDDRSRYCGVCKRRVYQLSAMSTDEVEELLRSDGATPCVRFYQRADGTVMTADCPTGAQARRFRRGVVGLGLGAVAALGGAAAAAVPPYQARHALRPLLEQILPDDAVDELCDIVPAVTMGVPAIDDEAMRMGEVAPDRDVGEPPDAPVPEPVDEPEVDGPVDR